MAALAVEGRFNFYTGVLMLWTISAILVILWLLGVVSSYTLGGYIHVLLVVAVVFILVRLIQGNPPINL